MIKDVHIYVYVCRVYDPVQIFYGVYADMCVSKNVLYIVFERA